jgi:hypothetical protein
MAEKLIPSEFTPSGGMNQDSSITTPEPGLEGQVSLFQHGDYRYALNMRIGSSRDDSMGDGEAIKSTRKVDKYYAITGAFVNPDFEGSIAPWEQIIDIAGWTWDSPLGDGFVFINPGDHSVIYQPFSGGIGTIQYKYSMLSIGIVNFRLQAVFLTGSSVIGSQDIDTRTGSLVDIFTGSVDLSIPVGTDGIGLRAMCDTPGVFNCILLSAQVIGWGEAQKPAGSNRAIGKYEDEEFLTAWKCTTDTDAIQYYDLVADAVYEVLKWTGLNWGPDSFVKCAKLDNWMALTDRTNAPRLIDTDTISELFKSLGDNFREFHISFHKWSPVGAPIVKRYYDGSTDNSDILKNKMWQFSYRYLYHGNLQSRWSPISTAACNAYDDSEENPFVPITAISVYLPGLFLDENGLSIENNYFNHNDAKCKAAIDKIQIAVRDNEIGIWRLWETISPTTSAQLFSGQLDNTPIPNDDFYQPFDTVPLKAGTVEAIDNRFVFGDILEEETPATPVQVTSVSVVKNDSNTPDWNSRVSSVFTGVVSPGDKSEIAERNAVAQRTFKSRGLYKLGIQYLSKTGWRSAVYTAENWIYNIPAKTIFSPTNSEPNYALAFKFSSGFIPPEWAVAYQIVRTNCLNIDSFLYGTCNEIQPIIDDLAGYVSGLTKASEPLITAIREHFLNASLVTAKDYNDYLDVLKNNPMYSLIVGNIRKNKTSGTVAGASRLYIDIRNWYNGSRADNSGNVDNPINNLLYNYRPGDRVRFVASTSSSPVTPSSKKIFDVKILDFTGDGIIVERPASVLWVPTKSSTNTTQDDYLIEVYTPKEQKESDPIFYESGEWFPVRYPGTSLRNWSKSDWTYTAVSGITASSYGDFTVFNKQPFYFGDCSRFQKFIYNDFRSNSTGTLYLRAIPSMSHIRDETYGRWEHATGRPYPAYMKLPVQKFKTTMARFSGKIVEQSFINNLNRMRDEDQYIYPSEYGRIRDLVNTNNAQVESVGSVLLAIGEREAWSIYVNRTTAEDLSGRTQVLLSDRVLGSFNTLLGSLGTFNPESVTRQEGRVYWWCTLLGSWARYGRDGLTKISDYKMRTWFKQISDTLLSKYTDADTPRVISGFDPFNEELVTRIDHTSLPDEFRGYADYKGSLFSESDKRWKSCHTYDPEIFAKIGNRLLLFKDGDVFIHEEGADYRTFFGFVQPVKIEPVFNPFMKDMKVWQALTVIATHAWEIERVLSEYRGDKTVQQSRIPLSQVKDKEDTYYAPFFRDENSQGSLYKGDRMRSKAIKTLLVLGPDVVTRTLLHYVQAEFHSSPKTP